MRTLFVAAGGGGDALGALLIRRFVAPEEDETLIGTCAWERLRVDPVPGPRPSAGFTHLGHVAGTALEVLDRSDTRPPGRSTLPRLVRETKARVFLIDLDNGATGVADQLLRVKGALHADRMILVDVGGDAIATGQEQGLLSPMADALMLAGALRADSSVALLIAGAGLDGELQPDEVHRRIRELGGHRVGTVSTADARPLLRVLRWHPTEGTGLLAAAALGTRGSVEMRRGNTPVAVTDDSTSVWWLAPLEITQFPIARACFHTRSLAEAEEATRPFAPAELEYERMKAHKQQEPTQLSRDAVIQQAREIAKDSPDATHITTRRLLERLGVPSATDRAVIDILEDQCQRDGPLWRLRDLALLH
ncbi:MAG: DUF1152 domain-containing protein [Dermatophilaceae bacterium]